VIRFIEEYKEKGGDIERFMYQGVKAHYMRAKNMLNVMEYKAAKKILEEEAKPLLQLIIAKYLEDEKEVDPTKDLPDNRYSFIYRKKYVLFQKKFAFYQRAAENLQTILTEEIEYYNLEEEKNEKMIKHIKYERASQEE